MTQLIVFRPIQGIGAGGMQPIALTIVGDIFKIEERAISGRLIAKVGFRVLVRFGFFLVAASAIWLTFAMTHGASAGTLRIGSAFLGLGMGFSNTPLVIAVQTSVGFAGAAREAGGAELVARILGPDRRNVDANFFRKPERRRGGAPAEMLKEVNLTTRLLTSLSSCRPPRRGDGAVSARNDVSTACRARIRRGGASRSRGPSKTSTWMRLRSRSWSTPTRLRRSAATCFRCACASLQPALTPSGASARS